MAITNDLISATAELQGLTEAQRNAIITLSQNDENSVIGTRIGEIYRQMDATIASATGIERNGDEKTYNYLERATKGIKEKADSVTGLSAQIATLTKEKNRLEKVISEGGGDEEIKKDLAQAKKDLVAVTKQFTDLKGEYDKAKADHATELFNLQINGEFAKATASVKFKADLPQTVTNVILEQAIAKVKGMHPEYIDDGKGGKVLAFKGEGGEILRNADNMLNPYTASELINKELKAMGVLAEGSQTQGGGTKPITTTTTNGTIDISGARTRVEAQEVIEKGLMAQGLTKGSMEYQTALDKAWTDNKVSDLPMQ